jgi:hypothetical protein
MKRYPVFLARFALVPVISGTFVVSSSGRAAPVEWAHIIAGCTMIYLIVGLLLRSWMHPELRLPAALALALALGEAIPGEPRLHAMLSPLLFTVVVWASVALPATPERTTPRNLRMWFLPAPVLVAIFYGVGYRHQTSSIVPHIGMAMLAAGLLLGVCLRLNEKYPTEMALRRVSNLTIAAVLFQITAGITAMVIRMIDINGGLTLALARTAHITGAAMVIAAAMLLAIQYGRSSLSNPNLPDSSPTAAETSHRDAVGAPE